VAKKFKASSTFPKTQPISKPASSSIIRAASDEDNIEVSSSSDKAAEEDAHLRGFSSGSDDSDSDDSDTEEVGLNVSSLPTVAKDDATVKRKLEAARKLPVGFFFIAKRHASC
jgi:nucleolar protein 15